MSKNKRWSEQELMLFEKLINTAPIEILTDKINEFHIRNKTGINRTIMAVKEKIYRNNYSSLPTLDNMSCRRWAKELRINKITIQRWVNKKKLSAIKVSNRYVISIKDMKMFANKYPYLLAGISEDILTYYFGMKLTKFILENKMKPYQIQRLDNNVIYPNLTQASKSLGMHSNTVKKEAGKGIWLKFV